MKTIALTGGGTAGHIMPNLALLSELKKTFDRMIYLGAGGMEERLAKAAGLKFFKTEAVRLERTQIWKNAKIPVVLSRAVREAKKILKEERVDCVFGKGGYVALPTAIAAKLLHIPLVIHESDFSMGVANKLLARFADGVITSFPETKGGVYLGNPIRDEIFFGNRKRTIEELKLKNKQIILIVGGSLGAEVLNRLVWDNLGALSEKFNVIHVAGKGFHAEAAAEDYRQFPMTDRIPDLFAAADVVITRAGANTLSELAALGKRTVAVPLPKGASRGDQEENARSYENRGLVRVLKQNDLTLENLIKAVELSLSNPPPKASGRGEINRNIVAYIANVMNDFSKGGDAPK